jgi:hypothetical protein
MIWLSVHSGIAKLDLLFGKVDALYDDPELQSHWAQYLCVKCAGLLETAISDMFLFYCESACSPQVYRYVRRHLSGFQNANHEKIAQLVSTFDPAWEQPLTEFLDEKRKASIVSIVNNRHKIAHGRNNDVSITRLSAWYKDEKELLGFLYHLLFPAPPRKKVR